MTVYVHHVPGRLRVRSPVLARCPDRRACLERELAVLPGILAVATNPKAGSVIVRYDPTIINPEAILTRFSRQAPHPAPALPRAGQTARPLDVTSSASKIGALFGKALFDAVLHKGVERSVRILMGR